MKKLIQDLQTLLSDPERTEDDPCLTTLTGKLIDAEMIKEAEHAIAENFKSTFLLENSTPLAYLYMKLGMKLDDFSYMQKAGNILRKRPSQMYRLIEKHKDYFDGKGYVGIFWRVEPSRWAIDRTPIGFAEPYGDALTHPISHDEYWSKSEYRKLGEYTDFPRGRVVYFPKTSTFVVYRDARLAEVVEEQFKDWFPPNAVIEYKSDPHYRKLL